ncbi:hypothetical protein C475_08336 [Halosimplex carlsbadense 2-9-1]|uniref:DUF6199 domain-containing protein n=1 Tax=Halosimplex carlsbadense 2-9-1 TaxID=797114 RepID=M0CWA3_9EURY|nr:hypothetical protein [Halosimplex carlsbadense]ELZ26928.1 hypothetical protein C475_08336 [Halosimplex carlsbadense 2-9-1]
MTVAAAASATLVGAVLFAVGLFGVLQPYTVALWRERLDAVGSTRSWNDVEPTDWRVTIARYTFAIFLAGGALFLWMAGQQWLNLL